MAKRKLPLPAERELEILNTLWKDGPSTVGHVNKQMNKNRPTGYTTTLKLMQRMHDKDQLLRDESKWPHVYMSVVKEESAHKRLVKNLLEKAFAGSAEKLLVHALRVKKLSAEELAKIRKIFDELEAP